MLEVGYERPSAPPHEPEDDILQPSTSTSDPAPADRLATSDTPLGFGVVSPALHVCHKQHVPHDLMHRDAALKRNHGHVCTHVPMSCYGM